MSHSKFFSFCIFFAFKKMQKPILQDLIGSGSHFLLCGPEESSKRNLLFECFKELKTPYVEYETKQKVDWKTKILEETKKHPIIYIIVKDPKVTDSRFHFFLFSVPCSFVPSQSFFLFFCLGTMENESEMVPLFLPVQGTKRYQKHSRSGSCVGRISV